MRTKSQLENFSAFLCYRTTILIKKKDLSKKKKISKVVALWKRGSELGRRIVALEKEIAEDEFLT